ncbi:nuclear transport factor 2 family protein [Cupriavidus pauculus]|uniref:Nuclear transport factor 2 family protein n=1 Tax=Cupriavidus pauculus TaxID=82633 RepID=A0A2N5C3B4_9BURK|nr:nuclear transport factor 2 family protein [Cupriavidus pauculus]PLP96712.1 nuclear transport factor 2 family protein [Cupriavidus pauculus]
MKLRSAILPIIFLASTVNFANAATTDAAASGKPTANAATAVDVKEYEAIKRTLGLYLEGGRQGKSAIMKPAFHPNAVMYGGAGDSMQGGPIKSLFEYIDGHPPATGLNAYITKIEVQNQVAFARIESDNWNGARFSDMFLLVKDSGNWKILTKIYHQYGAN